MNKQLQQFKKEFYNLVPPALASICLWLDHDIGLPEAYILAVMNDLEKYLYFIIIDYLDNEGGSHERH